MALISEVYQEAQALLNDNVEVFTDAALLPFVKKAYDELQREMQLRGIQVSKEISAVLTVPANTPILNAVGSFPADFLYPIRLEERDSGSTQESDFRNVSERFEELGDGVNPNTTIGIWAFRENEVKLRLCTAIRSVRLHYVKSLVTIVDGTSTVGIIDAKGFLAARSAAIAVFALTYNETLATTLQAESEKIKQDLIGIAVLKQQSLPVRRRPFRRGGFQFR